MLRMTEDRAAWELKNEQNKVNVRWLLLIVITVYLAYLLDSGKAREIGGRGLFNWYYIGFVTAGTFLLNAVFMIYLMVLRTRGGTIIRALKYITMSVDFIAVSLVVIPTGGSESLFFVVYFIVIVSNGLRYGMRMALFGVAIFNVCYVGVLVYQSYPQLEMPGMQREILKVAGFWLVGIYVGYLARRFEILQGQVEKYQRLTAKLMERRDES